HHSGPSARGRVPTPVGGDRAAVDPYGGGADESLERDPPRESGGLLGVAGGVVYLDLLRSAIERYAKQPHLPVGDDAGAVEEREPPGCRIGQGVVGKNTLPGGLDDQVGLAAGLRLQHGTVLLEAPGGALLRP